MTRRACTAKQALEVAIEQGAVIPCFRCRLAFTSREAKDRGAIEREHLVPLALGGKDIPSNWAWSHKGCHAKQTNGRSHLGEGDKYEIAKAKRLANGGKKRRGAKIQNRSDWPKGQKIPSRPFDVGDRE